MTERFSHTHHRGDQRNVRAKRPLGSAIGMAIVAISTALLLGCEEGQSSSHHTGPTQAELVGVEGKPAFDSASEVGASEGSPGWPLVARAHAADIQGSQATDFRTVEWVELMPKSDLDALLNPPEYITEVEDGSLEDQISGQLQNSIAAAADDRYQQALVSTNVVEALDGQSIRIPGFIVPLEFDDDQTITQFFLVPFFGACIHVPPPPPNQIVLVNAPQGLKLDVLYDPFWITGELMASLNQNDLATSAYEMTMAGYEPYTESGD